MPLTCFWLPMPRGPRYVKPQNHLKSESKIQFPNFIWMKKRAYLFNQYGIMNESEFIKLLISGCDWASQMEISTLKISTHLIKCTLYIYTPLHAQPLCISSDVNCLFIYHYNIYIHQTKPICVTQWILSFSDYLSADKPFQVLLWNQFRDKSKKTLTLFSN